MGRVFIISDLHLGHTNMAIKRGFASSEEHDNHLIEEWNKVVHKNDTVFLLGDESMEKKAPYALLGKMKGIKKVILGNHNRPQDVPELLKYVNSVGGAGVGFGGGFPLFGLLGIKGIDSFGGDHRKEGKGGTGKSTLAILQGLSNNKDVTVQEARGLAAAICDSEKTNLQQFYALAVQNSNDTQAIKDQAIALAIANNQNITEVKEAGVAQTAAILARMNDLETQRLRDELELSRHGLRAKEVEISIQNTNTNIQQQMQQQQQQQMQRDFDVHRRFDSLFVQTAKASQDIVNIGGLMAGTSQTANPVNVK